MTTNEVELWIKERIPEAFNIQTDDALFAECCQRELTVASELETIIRNKRHAVRTITQANAPIVILKINSFYFDDEEPHFSTFTVVFSKIVKLVDIKRPTTPFGRHPGITGTRMLAAERNHEMSTFLKDYVAQNDYVLYRHINYPHRSQLFFNPAQYPRLNEDVFSPDGHFIYEDLFFNDILDRFSFNQRCDEFTLGRLKEEYLGTSMERKEVYMTQEEYIDEYGDDDDD